MSNANVSEAFFDKRKTTAFGLSGLSNTKSVLSSVPKIDTCLRALSKLWLISKQLVPTQFSQLKTCHKHPTISIIFSYLLYKAMEVRYLLK